MACVSFILFIPVPGTYQVLNTYIAKWTKDWMKAFHKFMAECVMV